VMQESAWSRINPGLLNRYPELSRLSRAIQLIKKTAVLTSRGTSQNAAAMGVCAVIRKARSQVAVLRDLTDHARLARNARRCLYAFRPGRCPAFARVRGET